MTTHPTNGVSSRSAVPAPLDHGAIERLRGFGGDRLLAQMIDLFATSGRTRLDAAQAAARSHDCAGVQAALHSLKSSAGQIGATALQELCAVGEARAAAGEADGLVALVACAHDEFIAAVRALQRMRPAIVLTQAGGAG